MTQEVITISSYSGAYVVIDLDVMESNMRVVKGSLLPATSAIGVIKTDGCGREAVPVAKTIDPCAERHAVVTVDGAVILHRHGIQKMILVLGATHGSRFGDSIRYDIRPAMFRYEGAGKLSKTTMEDDARTNIHLAVDTDMSRIGIVLDEASAGEMARIARLPRIRIEGMFTHFTRVGEADKEFYEAQYKKYRDFCRTSRSRGVDIPVRHCSNSTGIVGGLDSNGLDMVHAGISIYSLYPSDEVVRDRVKLAPVVGLKSVITHMETIEPGTFMGYGGTFIADRPARIVTIPVEYRGGYPRNLSNKGAMLIRREWAGILGRIYIGQFMTDVTGIPEAAEGDQATLIGKSEGERITVEELAHIGGGFRCEIICGVGRRVPKVYPRDEKAVEQKNYFNDVCEGFGYM